MIFRKTLISAAAAALTIASTSVSASPIAHPDSSFGLDKRAFGGYNDWNCKPSSSYPYPIVMTHGLGGNSGEWVYMATRFAAKGYCTFALDYGHLNEVPFLNGLDDLRTSANQLSDFVDKVLIATGAPKVDILGHSEGSTLPRVYFKYNNGDAKTRKFAGIDSNSYGTTLSSLTTLMESLGLHDVVEGVLNPVCKACFQLIVGAPFLEELNTPNDTVPGVQYLMIASKYDPLVTPYQSGWLKDNNPNVKNQLVQDWCALDFVGHIAQATDAVIFNGVHNFFSDNGKTASCLSVVT
ncbi:MAG: Alpha/Beta hydrolase protein [Podila humilis]|nr:MAG: Alpha/Beta hydrolase protein [Podila humilis]